MRTRLRVVLGLVVAAATSLAAQQAPVFRAGVSLLQVDVSVVDRDGKPVPGLAAADFTVTLDGKPAAVRSVDYESIPAAPAPAAGISDARRRQVVSNAAPSRPPRVFVILADDLSMTASRGKRMFFAGSRFVAGLPPEDLVGFATSSRLTAINPTLNHQAIEAALRHTVGDLVDPREIPPQKDVGLIEALQVFDGNESVLNQVIQRDCGLGPQSLSQALATSDCANDVRRKAQEVGALARQQGGRQLAAWLDVINALRAAPGVKYVVLISDGLAVDWVHTGNVDPIARAAAAAGVQLIMLTEEPDMVDLSTPGGSTQARLEDNRLLQQNIEAVAGLAGGIYYHSIGAPDPFFAKVAASASGVYRLGVAAPEGAAPGRDFALTVRVDRRNVEVHANRHAVAPAPVETQPVDVRLRNAVTQGTPLYDVPMTLGALVRRGQDPATLDVDANVEIPASAPGPITLRFGLLDRAGRVRTGTRTVAAPAGGGDYRVTLSLPVPPGDYELRFAVADAQGRVGSIDEVVGANLQHLGPYLASDLLTSWSAADGAKNFLALETLPKAATTLQAFLELYPASGAKPPSDVHVRFTLAPADESAAAVEMHDVTPTARGDTAYSGAQFAVATLPAGEYTLTATVLDKNGPIGSTATTIIR